MNFTIMRFFPSMASMVGRPGLANHSPLFLGTKNKAFTVNKTNHLAGSFFSQVFNVMGFKSFSFHIPKTLMDQFYRSVSFYKRFPQLRPKFRDSSSIYSPSIDNIIKAKLFKPIC